LGFEINSLAVIIEKLHYATVMTTIMTVLFLISEPFWWERPMKKYLWLSRH